MRRSAIRIGLGLSIGLAPAAAGGEVRPAADSERPALDQATSPAKRLPQQLLMEIYIKEGAVAVEAASIPVLENFIEQALEFPDEPIELNGHTHDGNSPAEELAETRAMANALGTFLVGKGIAAARISTGGLGATRPRVVVEPGTRDRLNRRVNMTLGRKNSGW
jgi:outer membrane protein OmpA-like peptidoglycan-associated protein